MINRGGVAFVLALACLLSTAPAAGAERARPKPRFETHERSLSLSVLVEASNGYRGRIETEGHKRVRLALSKGETRVEALTTGHVTRHGIKAQFGDMGKISVRFRGEPLHLGRGNKDGERRCRGRKSRFERGLFKGTIRFRGENDFTRVNMKQAEGHLERHYRRVCQHDPLENLFTEVFKQLIDDLRLTVLRARTRVEGVKVEFLAAAVDLSSILGPEVGFSYGFSAQTLERVEGMWLVRSVSTEGDEGSFLYPRRKKGAPRTVTVTPPKPFTGTAKYLKRAGSPNSWVGSLAARLPGAGLIEMTGPGFRTTTCKLTYRALYEGDCPLGSDQVQLRSLPHLDRALPQISDSLSLAFWEAARPSPGTPQE